MSGKTRKQQIEEMLADDPHDPFLLYGLAMEYVSAGDDGEAVRRFQTLLSVAPQYVPAYLQTAQAQLRLGQDEAAREVLQRGLTIAHHQGDSHAAAEMQALLESLT